MSKCFVFNVDKFKNGDVSKIHNHNFRTYGNKQPKFDNVDFERTKNNKILVGGKETRKIINEKIKNLKLKKKPRSDANLMLNFVFSASPEYFFKALEDPIKKERWQNLRWSKPEHRREILEVWKSLDQSKVEEFQQIVVDYCKKEFGDNIVNIVLHMDEKNVHIHCQTVPITPDKKLSCKQVYTPAAVKDWRSKLAIAMAPLGLDEMREETPGVEVSADEFNMLDEVVIEQPPKVQVKPALTENEVFKDGLFGKKQIISTETILQETKERNKELQKQQNFLVNFYKKNLSLVTNAKRLELENKKLKGENMELKKQNKKLSTDQLEKLREIDCNDVLQSLGYEPKKEGITTRLKTDSMNLVVNSQNKFTENKSMTQGYGAIDLLTKVFDYSFKEASEFLASKFGFDRTARLITANPKNTEKTIVNALKKDVLELPKPKPQNNAKVVKYLTETRKLDKNLIENLVNQELIYADEKNNCVFVNEKKSFAFLRGTYEGKRFVGTRGEIDFIKYDFADYINTFDPQPQPRHLYLFESTIEALSYKTLYPDTEGHFVVLNGSALINRIHELGIDKYDVVHCCFNNDDQGRKFDAKITEQTTAKVEIHKPIRKDFNEDLVNGKPADDHDSGGKIQHQPIAGRNQQDTKAVAGKTEPTSATSEIRNHESRRRFPR